MLKNKKFSNRDWEMAPVFGMPEGQSRLMPLDFTMLASMATEEEVKGAFRLDTEDSTLAVAPFYFGHLPAAFIRVETEREEQRGKHKNSGRDMIFAVDGLLKLARNPEYRNSRTGAEERVIAPGEGVQIVSQAIDMEAMGVFRPASCLAIAICASPDVSVNQRQLPILGEI